MQKLQLTSTLYHQQYKLIRHQRNLHLGQFLLMQDISAKRRVALKSQPYRHNLHTILHDVRTLVVEGVVPLVNYVVEGESSTHGNILLIYDYHQHTLNEVSHLSQGDIVRCGTMMWECLGRLEQRGIHHLGITCEDIIVEDEDSINVKFKLLLTPFLEPAYEQIKENSGKMDMYNLSKVQLQQLNRDRSTETLTKKEKLATDKQALGLLLLRLASRNPSLLYHTNQNFQLCWDQQSISHQLTLCREKYSEQLVCMMEYMLFCDNFHTFHTPLPRKKPSPSKIIPPSPQKGSPQRVHASKPARKQMQRSGYQQQLAKLERAVREKIKLMGGRQVEHVYGDGSRYVGMVRDQHRHGLGMYYFKEGDVYGGSWQEDEICGKGMYIFVMGETYEGEVKAGIKDGAGKYVYSNGNVYEGGWKADTKHGYGVYHYHTRGEVYEGEFDHGVKEGYGTYVWPNGDRYVGYFKAGLKHGQATCTKSDGTIMKGTWSNDEIQGTVHITYRSGVQYVGEFPGGLNNVESCVEYKYSGGHVHGRKHGEGSVNFVNGDEYVGGFREDKMDGEGCYYYRDSDMRYMGKWRDSKQDGDGMVVCGNGTRIKTKWNDGFPSKQGIIEYYNGDRYEGEISSGGPHGHGVYVQANGQKFEGMFKNSKFISNH